MRILLLSNMYPSPARPEYGVFLQRLAEALRGRGQEVTEAVTTSDARAAANAAGILENPDLATKAVTVDISGRMVDAEVSRRAFYEARQLTPPRVIAAARFSDCARLTAKLRSEYGYGGIQSARRRIAELVTLDRIVASLSRRAVHRPTTERERDCRNRPLATYGSPEAA